MCRAKNMWCHLLYVTCLLLVAISSEVKGQTGVTAFEGARLITGDGNIVENSAFVVENNRFTSVGRRSDVLIPAGAARVELKGKTVMPMMIDLHGHIGYQNVAQGTMSKETYTRENLIDHLERLAYHGVSAIVGIGDLVTRSDMRGGRTNWGDVHSECGKRLSRTRHCSRPRAQGWPGREPERKATRPELM
jgi:imidazolonepropionase-like amidohydrolase